MFCHINRIFNEENESNHLLKWSQYKTNQKFYIVSGCCSLSVCGGQHLIFKCEWRLSGEKKTEVAKRLTNTLHGCVLNSACHSSTLYGTHFWCLLWQCESFVLPCSNLRGLLGPLCSTYLWATGDLFGSTPCSSVFVTHIRTEPERETHTHTNKPSESKLRPVQLSSRGQEVS